VVAPGGTVAVIWVALFTMKDAAVPLSFRLDAPVRFVPLMITLLPVRPLMGLKPVMVGGCSGTVTLKLLPELAVPLAVVTEIFPLVAPLGTVAVTWAALATAKEAEVPLNETTLVPERLLPVMVTVAPIGPLPG